MGTARTKRRTLPLGSRIAVWDAAGGVCHYCGEALHPLRDFTVDHVMPVARGGSDEPSNLVAACRRCNGRKGTGTAPGVPAVAPGELTVGRVAYLLQVNEQTVRRWLREGELGGVPFGGKTGWRVTEEDLQAFLDRRRAERETGKAAA